MVKNSHMKGGRGLTLVESLIWIVIFSISITAIISSILYFYRTNTYTIHQAGAVSSAQRGIDKMIRVFREAAYASNGAYPIVSIGQHDIVLYADVDNDAFIERLHYYIDGLNLREGLLKPTGDPPAYSGVEATTTLSAFVHNINQATTTFAYFDKNGVPISDYSKIAEVRFITVSLIVNVDPVRLPNQILLRSSAAIRNLR